MSFLGGTLRAIRRRLRHAWRPPAIVLLYHRVADLEADPQALAITPARFAEHLEALRGRYRPLAVSAVAAGARAGRLPRGAIAVTFDDGYADNLQAAKPLLERFDVPATVYVATGTIGTAREFWWDELERLLLASRSLPARLSLRLGGTARSWELDGAAQTGADRWTVLDGTVPSPRHRAYLDLSALLHPLSAEERAAALAELRRWAGVGDEGRASHRPLTADEVARLGDGDLVEIGAHTVTHTRLASLGPEAQRREVRDGKAQLEQILGRPVETFSYPYGYCESYGARTVSIVRESGFSSACSNFPGLVEEGTDPFQLPRFVVRDWSGDELLRKLRAGEAER